MADERNPEANAANGTIDPKFIAEARAARDVDELAELAAKRGFVLAPGQVEEIYDRLRDTPASELADEELENVAGGCGASDARVCPLCGKSFVLLCGQTSSYCPSCTSIVI